MEIAFPLMLGRAFEFCCTAVFEVGGVAGRDDDFGAAGEEEGRGAVETYAAGSCKKPVYEL